MARGTDRQRPRAHLTARSAPRPAARAGRGHGSVVVGWLPSDGRSLPSTLPTVLAHGRSTAADPRAGHRRAHRLGRGRPRGLDARGRAPRGRHQPVRPLGGVRGGHGVAARDRVCAGRALLLVGHLPIDPTTGAGTPARRAGPGDGPTRPSRSSTLSAGRSLSPRTAREPQPAPASTPHSRVAGADSGPRGPRPCGGGRGARGRRGGSTGSRCRPPPRSGRTRRAWPELLELTGVGEAAAVRLLQAVAVDVGDVVDLASRAHRALRAGPLADVARRPDQLGVGIAHVVAAPHAAAQIAQHGPSGERVVGTPAARTAV